MGRHIDGKAFTRRTSSVLVESAEYSVNTTPFFSPAVTVCVLAGDVSIAVSPVLSRSAQREPMRAVRPNSGAGIVSIQWLGFDLPQLNRASDSITNTAARMSMS
jgi:hypothetical protein